MGLWDRLRGRGGAAKGKETRKLPSEVRWISAEVSPFGVRTLDITPTTGGMISTTTDMALAARSTSWRNVTSEAIPPVSFGPEAVTVPCALTYAAAPELPDGLLFVPSVMEEKWVLCHRGGSIVAVRSWTGEVAAAARGARVGDRLVLEELTLKPAGLGPFGDPVQIFDWLVRTHALNQRLPLPVAEEELEMIAHTPLVLFSPFGAKAQLVAVGWAPPDPGRPLRVFSDLVQAVRAGDLAKARALLARGADPNVPSPLEGYTALHAVMVRGDAETMRVLLAAGANPRARTDRGMSPLGLGIVNGAPIALLDELVAAGAETDAVNADGFGLLHAAAETNRPEIIGWLVGRGLELEARTGRGLTPLHIACGLGHADAARALIAAGADRNATSPLGTPRDCALAEKHPALATIVETLG